MLILPLILLTILRSTWSISRKPILIVVSYDGFRYDYLNSSSTPNMFKLRQEGAFAEYMYNVFPTKTFPNHFTIATGMYSEVHGVLGNTMYDPDLKKVIGIGEAMFTQNKEITPIWTLNELAGEGRHSGIMMWPGGLFAYKHIMPTYFAEWIHESHVFRRVDKVIEWLTDPEKPANLVMMYIETPDCYAHVYGADSPRVKEEVKLLDKLTQYLDDQLRIYNLKDLATVVHLSDHGMGSVQVKNIINITQYLQPNTYIYAETSAIAHITPKEGYENSTYDTLKKAADMNKTFDVYKRSEFPERWHFKKNKRTPPILLMCREGYAFEDILEMANRYNDSHKGNITPETTFGLHGYDPELPMMHPFFMVRGPKIKRNHLMQPFSSVNLYDFFAAVLEIKSVPNNGTLLIHKDIMVELDISSVSSAILLTVGGVLLSLLLISCAAGITILLIKRQQSMTTTAALNKRFPQTFQQSIEAQHLLESEEA